MIDRSITRIDAMLAFLGGRSEASLAGVMSDPGLCVGETAPPAIKCCVAHRGYDGEAGASKPLPQGQFSSRIVASRAAG
jgi:hypothetical protein